MKLHLPKALLTAVLAACMVNTTAWGVSTTTENSGWGKIYSDGNPATDSYAIGDATGITEISTADGTGSNMFLRSNKGVGTATIGTLNVTGNKTLNVQGWWKNDTEHPQFESLTISNLTFGNNSVLNVAAGNTVKVDAYTGTFKGTIDGTLTIGGVANLTNAAISGAGSLIITGNPKSDRDTGASVIGGTATISCTSSEIGGTLGIRGNGTLKYTGGTHSVTKLDIHNQNGYYETDALIISGATVNVTGTDDSENMNNASTGPAAVTVGHWNNGTGKISVGGESAGKSVFNVFDGTIRMSYNASSNLTIGKNGIVNAMGIQYSNFHDGYGTDTAVINLQGGRLNLGSGGLSANTSKTNVTLARELNLQSGTLGALANSVKIGAGDVNLSGAVTIDTAILGRDGVATGGKATITFSQALNAQEGASLTIQGGGTVSLSSINMSHTLDLSILDNTNLTIEAVVLNPNTMALTGKDSYYSMDGGTTQSKDANGFLYNPSGDYVLFDGYAWKNTQGDGYTVYTEGNSTYVHTAPTISTTYYLTTVTADIDASKFEADTTYAVQGGTMNIVGTMYGSDIQYTSGIISLANKNSTLVLDNESNAASLLSRVTTKEGDAGTIKLDTNASYSGNIASQAEGKLIINKGVTLSVGSGSDDSSNISSFSSVDLKGGALSLNGASSEVKSLTVSEAKGTLTVKNANSGHRTYTLSGTTTLNADLDITSPNEHGDVIVKELTGSKNLSVVGGNAHWGGIMARLEKLTDYTGSITVDNEGRAASPNGPKYTNIEFGVDDGAAAFTTLKGLEIKGNAYATVYAKGESTIESLTLNKGTLNYKTNYGAYTYTLDKVEVKGSGAIAINSDNTYNEGEVTIKNLKNAEGETSGELTLSSNFKDGKANVFNLEDGDFSGKIVFKSQSDKSDAKSYHALNIKNQDVLSKAVVEIKDDKKYSHMGLALGADKVIVKGISGTAENVAIYSGVQAFQSESFTSDNTARTLEIATGGKDENYVSAASIKKNVNLVKSGEGSQTFTSDSIDSKSVSVLGGGLSLTGIDTLQLQDLVVKSGATLTVGSNGSGVVSFGDSTAAPASTTSSTQGAKAKLEGGAIIDGGLDLSGATSLTLDGVGSNPVYINGDLKLTTGSLTLSGDVLNSIASLHAGEQLEIFDVKGGFFVGGTQYSEALTASNGIIILDTIFSSEDINLENYYLGFYNIPDEAGYSTVYIGMIVPEPTTATLSLLALAALAARRRRK